MECLLFFADALEDCSSRKLIFILILTYSRARLHAICDVSILTDLRVVTFVKLYHTFYIMFANLICLFISGEPNTHEDEYKVVTLLPL